MIELFQVVRLAASVIRLFEAEVPVLHRLQRVAARTHLQIAALRQQPRLAKQSSTGEEILEGEIFGEALDVQRRLQGAMRKNRLDLRTEQETAVGLCPIDWLHAEAVARNSERSLVSVPNSEGKHAVEAAQNTQAPFGERMEHNLAVGATDKRVATA